MRKAGLDISVAVNISGRLLGDGAFAEKALPAITTLGKRRTPARQARGLPPCFIPVATAPGTVTYFIRRTDNVVCEWAAAKSRR